MPLPDLDFRLPVRAHRTHDSGCAPRWNLAWDLEGEEVAARLNALGITGVVLKYRVPRRPGEPERLPARGPLLDAQRAISLVRSRAADWGIEQNPAGVEINANTLAPYLRIPANTPPVFLVHASDDRVAGPENSVVLYQALRQSGVSAELHVYAQGGHGFGVRESQLPCSTWIDRCAEWLSSLGLPGATHGSE